MKPKVGVGVSGFQSAKEIPRLLEPIYEHVDKIYYIDGKYPHFEYPSDYSTDDTVAILAEYPNIRYHQFSGYQIPKRNEYLRLAREDKMDFVLVLDTDDYLHSQYQDWDTFYKQLEAIPENKYLYNMWFWMSPLHVANWNLVTDDTFQLYTRILRPDKVQYDTCHWLFTPCDNPYCFVMPTEKDIIDGIRFNSDSVLRDKDYTDKGFDWANKQLNDEDSAIDSPEGKLKKFNYWVNWVENYVK